MRIALIAPLYESVPPKLYGGTERVVSALADALVAKGCKVTLFASGDSKTSARLQAMSEEGLRLDRTVYDPLAHHYAMVKEVWDRAAEFDVIHSHVDYIAFPFALAHPEVASVHTTHGRLDKKETRRVYQSFKGVHLISISASQQDPTKDLALNWMGVVPNGLPLDLFSFEPHRPLDSSAYLVFLGRICPEKGIDTAVRVAYRVSMRLIIAAKVDEWERGYYENEVVPMLRDHPCAEFIGEVDESKKDRLLSAAYANLFPIRWPEPFGLTAIESMACGVPVITHRCGAMVEIVEEGVTGFFGDTFEELVAAVHKVEEFDRVRCRERALERFSAEAMADGYLRLYEKAIIEVTPRDARIEATIGTSWGTSPRTAAAPSQNAAEANLNSEAVA